MTSRFRGKYLSVIPVGSTHVYFPGSKNHYSYKKVGLSEFFFFLNRTKCLFIVRDGDHESHMQSIRIDYYRVIA